MTHEDFDIEDVLASKNTLKEKIKHLQAKIRVLELERMKLMRAGVCVDNKLRKMCDHNWIRETYAYSELYCSECGVFK